MKRKAYLLIAIFLLFIASLLTFLSYQFFINESHTSVESFTPLLSAAFALIVIFGFSIWIWALIDMLGNQKVEGVDRIVWALVIIFLNVLGGILYFLIAPRSTPVKRISKSSPPSDPPDPSAHPPHSN